MTMLGRPLPDERRLALARVGAIVEEPRFHGHLTGRENLRIVAAAREREAHERIDGALARAGLAERADERVKRYSQGMRQRLGVARALLGDPELLILDEPTNGLDPAGIHEFRAMIRGFVAEGRTVLLSSHLLDEVERICDRVAIVDRGRVVSQGTIAELAGGGERGAGDRHQRRRGGARDPVLPPRGRHDRRRRRGHPRRAAAGRGRRRGERRHRPPAGGGRRRDPSLRADAPSLEERFLEVTS